MRLNGRPVSCTGAWYFWIYIPVNLVYGDMCGPWFFHVTHETIQRNQARTPEYLPEIFKNGVLAVRLSGYFGLHNTNDTHTQITPNGETQGTKIPILVRPTSPLETFTLISNTPP